MKEFVLVSALVLALTGCSGDAPQDAAPGLPSVTVDPRGLVTEHSTATAPQALSYDVVATQPLPARLLGMALFVHHVAYVQGRHLVLMDWRSGERRTVLTSRYGVLIPLQQHGQADVRYLDVLDQRPGFAGDDPASPRRVVSIDLATGRATPVERRYDQVVVGEFDDAQYELVGGDVHAIWQQPDPDLPDQVITHTGGRIVQAAMVGHQLVWTQSPNVSTPDPAGVWTRDLFRPDLPATRLGRRGVPYDPIVGDDFAGWSDNGQYVVLVPTSGGEQVRLPGKVAWATEPAADRKLVAVAERLHGTNTLTVYAIG